jgi:hypothetical protein
MAICAGVLYGSAFVDRLMVEISDTLVNGEWARFIGRLSGDDFSLVRRQLDSVRNTEREACANLAETMYRSDAWSNAGKGIAAAIRDRKP